MQNEQKMPLAHFLNTEKMCKASEGLEKLLKDADMSDLETTFLLLSYCVQLVKEKKHLMVCVDMTWDAKEKTGE